MKVAAHFCLCVLLAAMAAAGGNGQLLPTEFEHDRIYVVPETTEGAAVRFYTDTGGGWNAATCG